MDEDTLLYNQMKDLPDFDCFPIPIHWYKKFGIPPRNPVPVSEYIESNYAMRMSVVKKDLPPIIINKPQQDGKLVEMVQEPAIPVEVIERPFELKEGEEFPAVLPFLKDYAPDEQSRPLADTSSALAGDDTTQTLHPQDETSDPPVQ